MEAREAAEGAAHGKVACLMAFHLSVRGFDVDRRAMVSKADG